MKTTNLIKPAVLALLTVAATSAYADMTQDYNASKQASDAGVATVVIVPDSTVTRDVEGKIAADKTVSALGVHASTQQGIVTLSGHVNTSDEASTLIQLAASTKGVKDVDAAKLMVKTGQQPYADSIITAKVKGAFVREQLFGSKEVPMMSIHVETKNATVYLTGTADNPAQAQTAMKLAKSVSGVKDVKSTVQVKQ